MHRRSYIHLHKYTLICTHTYTHTDSMRKPHLLFQRVGAWFQDTAWVCRDGPYHPACQKYATHFMSPIWLFLPLDHQLGRRQLDWILLNGILLNLGSVISYVNTSPRWEHPRTTRRVRLPNTTFISGIRSPQLQQSQDVSVTHQHCCDWFVLKIGPGN